MISKECLPFIVYYWEVVQKTGIFTFFFDAFPEFEVFGNFLWDPSLIDALPWSVHQSSLSTFVTFGSVFLDILIVFDS